MHSSYLMLFYFKNKIKNKIKNNKSNNIREQSFDSTTSTHANFNYYIRYVSSESTIKSTSSSSSSGLN